MGILLVIAKIPCVRERGGERRTECMCDKDTKSVCARGISLNEAIVCVCTIERTCLKKGKNLHRYKEWERDMYAIVEARVCGCIKLSRG